MRKGSFIVGAIPVVVGCALLATAAGATVRSLVYANSDLSVSIENVPATISAGRLLAYDVTVENIGADQATDVSMTQSLPGGATLVSARAPVGACAQAGGTLVCALGALDHRASTTVRVVVQTPAASGQLLTSARVSSDQNDTNPANNQFTSTVNLLGPNLTTAGAFLPANGSVSTGKSTKPGNPNATTVKVPKTENGIGVSITEQATSNPTKSCGFGYLCHGQIVVITLPGGSLLIGKPARITMRLDSSALGADDPTMLPVFRNRALIPDCFNAGTAMPAPCIESRTVLSGGDVRIVVLSVQGGRFRA